MTTALDRIIEYKREEVKALRASAPMSELLAKAKASGTPRDFCGRLNVVVSGGTNALICEIKRKSPSAGLIKDLKNPVHTAKAYEDGGAACLSVLTDGPSFGGSLKDLVEVRKSVTIPVLRKDFMIDPSQILEARIYNADAILIIMAAVDDVLAKELHDTATEFGMSVLLEAHNKEELERALKLPSPLVGINNRDLKRMVTDLATTETLVSMVPSNRLLISESGIKTIDDIIRLRQCGARGFLIGESLMKTDDIKNCVASLVNAV